MCYCQSLLILKTSCIWLVICVLDLPYMNYIFYMSYILYMN